MGVTWFNCLTLEERTGVNPCRSATFPLGVGGFFKTERRLIRENPTTIAVVARYERRLKCVKRYLMGSKRRTADTTTRGRGRPPGGPAFKPEEVINLDRLLTKRGWTTREFYERFCAINPREDIGLEYFRKLISLNGKRPRLRAAMRAAFASTIPATLEAFNTFLLNGDVTALSPVEIISQPRIPANGAGPVTSLTTRKDTPQWADFREFDLQGNYLLRLRCSILTNSPYFRFGFKLLAPNSKIFGDASIKSHDSNLVLHVGRNNWDRPHYKISADDMFFTYSINGINTEADRPIPFTHKKTSANLGIEIEPGSVIKFIVNGDCYFKRVMPPEIRRHIVMLAWGDHEECTVEVSDLVIKTTPTF